MHPERSCSHDKPVAKSVTQTLDEMDFERGIWQAALDGDYSRVKKLLDKGVSPDITDSSGYTALHYAARAGNVEVVKLLFEFKANPNPRTASGRDCPLHRSAYQGHENATRLLLENGADPLLQNADGQTALHKAVERKRDSVVNLLLNKCPSLKEIKDDKGKKPFDY